MGVHLVVALHGRLDGMILRTNHAMLMLWILICRKYSALSDSARMRLMSFSWYVFIYYTACSRFSVVNLSLGSLDCITAFELHFEYD